MKDICKPADYLDCIAMKRAIQKEIVAETKGMTPRERLAHYRRLADESPFALLIRERRPKVPGQAGLERSALGRG